MRSELRFYRGKGFLAWLVRFVTRSKYSHVEIVIDGLAFECFPNRYCRTRWSPEPSGIVVECKHGHYGRALEALGTGYDLWGALRSGTPFGREHPHKWFCSELAAYVIGLENPHLYSPQDLAEHYHLDK